MTFYKKALELDPDNDTYKSNMKIAEDKMDAGSPVKVTLCVLNRECESARPRVPCVPCVCVLVSDGGNGRRGPGRTAQQPGFHEHGETAAAGASSRARIRVAIQ